MPLLPFGSPPTNAATFSASGKVRQTIYNIKDHGAVMDGTTNDIVAIQAAIDMASAAGGGTVHFPVGTTLVHTPIKPKSNVTLRGIGANSIIITDQVQAVIQWSEPVGNDLTNFTVDCLTIKGSVSNTVSVPTRARTTSGSGADRGIWLRGSLFTTDPDGLFGTVSNITISNVRVLNTTWLPVSIFGATNVNMYASGSYNCQDLGFGFNDQLRVSNCYSYMSADNGFSISRGNKNVAFTNNTVELCAYDGFWFSGFIGDTGPNNFTCTGNTVKNFGVTGVRMIDAPKYGTIAGNTIDGNYNRGASDESTDSFCIGIMVRGDTTAPTAPTRFATELNIVGNTIRQVPRAGIMLDGCKDIKVSSNLICDVGTQFLSNGSTTIVSTDTTQNVGILVNQVNTYTRVYIDNNTITDSRGTPYCNYAIQPNPTAGVTTFGNKSSGLRNTQNLIQNFPQGDSLSVDTANATTLSGDGTDLSVVVPGRMQLYAGNSNGVLSGLNMNNPNTGSATGAGALFSAGAKTAFIGGFFNYRIDAASNAVFGIRLLSNAALTGTSAAAPLYLQGNTGGVTTNFNTDLFLRTAGNKLNIATGSNASAGTGTLTGGTVTISTTVVTASSLIFLTDTSNAANIGTLTVGTKTAGTSFVVNSSNVLDTSTFNWLIVN